MSNSQNRPSSTENRQSKPRQRLSQKQRWFLENVFEAGQSVTDALRNLNIRHSSFERWLTKPVFLNKLRMYLNQYYLQARLELARSASSAVSGLAFVSEKSLKHSEVRQACADLLHLHVQIAKAAGKNPDSPTPFEGLQVAQDGAELDKNGATLAQFGYVLDHNGILSDKVCNAKTIKNRPLALKTKETPKKKKTEARNGSDGMKRSSK
ncbi:MAG: hypothetical protein ACYTET_01800 [Planctomycetota bacterium]